MQELVGWTVGGLAVIVGVVLANLQNVTALVTLSYLRWGLIFIVVSLLLGVIAKQMLQAIAYAVSHLLEVCNDLFSEEGIAYLKECRGNPTSFAAEVKKFYLWPMSAFVAYSAKRGGSDFLISEKRFGRLFCVGLYFAWLHFLVGLLGLVIITLGIK